MDNIEEIASKHLGKAGDGSVVKPYVTPDNVDKTLLVPIPRHLNRTQYEIDDKNLPFVGFDVWNAYEVSALMDNGYPVSGMLKISYAADSESIVESKSLKLYLNSYNMATMGKTVNESLTNIINQVSKDLKEALGVEVTVSVFVGEQDTVRPIRGDFFQLEDYVDVENIRFNQYNENPNTLESYIATEISQSFKSYSLRSNCRVTNQPDWGDVFIYMKSQTQVTPESLLQYIVSMRKENHFHEEICECIYKRLYDKFNPDELFVACLYTRRGGIDINPVRASSVEVMKSFAANMNDPMLCLQKTLRQ